MKSTWTKFHLGLILLFILRNAMFFSSIGLANSRKGINRLLSPVWSKYTFVKFNSLFRICFSWHSFFKNSKTKYILKFHPILFYCFGCLDILKVIKSCNIKPYQDIPIKEIVGVFHIISLWYNTAIIGYEQLKGVGRS